MTNKKFSILFCAIFLFALGFISAAAIEDSLHVNVQVRDGSGNILTGTYKFDFNISTTSSCDSVVYNSTTTAATDARGIVSYYLENFNIDFNSQYYLCYYRDGTLKSASKIVRTPYSFNSKYLAGYSENYFMPLNTTATGTFSKVNVNSSAFLDDYDSSYFMPLNTSVTGTFDFNSGWQSGGLTIQNGNIYAQAGYFYNISSLQINQLEINGSLFPYPGYSNTFDLGNSSLLWRHLWLAGNANISGTLTTKTIVSYDWTNVSHVYLYNHTLSTFTAYNDSWDNRYLIADVSTALSNNITSVNTTKNIQELLNSTGIYTQGSLVNTTANIQALLNGTSLWLDSINVTGTSYLGRLIISADNISTNNIMSVNSTPTFSGNITFRNYSNEFMRITGEGNIGIGTASPGAKLEVAGTVSDTALMGIWGGLQAVNTRGHYIKLTGGTTGTTAKGYLGYTKTGSGTATMWTNELADAVGLASEGAGAVHIGTGDAATPQVTILSGGNVGIGTASPTEKLYLIGNATFAPNTGTTAGESHLQIRMSGTGDGSPNSIIIGANGTAFAGRAFIDTASAGVAAVTPLDFRIGGSTKMTIDTNGNVGIGTTSPPSLLSLGGTTPYITTDSADGSDTKVIVVGGGGGISSARGAVIQVYGNEHATAPGQVFIDGGNVANGDINFRTDAAQSRLFIEQGTGNVGIGTATPATLLNLHGSTAGFMLSNGGTAIDTTPNIGSSTDGYSLQYNRNTGEIAHMGFSTTGSTFQTFYTQTGGAASSEKMRIDSLGNVGIGTASPGAKLQLGTVGLNRGIAVGLWSDMSADGGGRGLFGGNVYLNYSNNIFYYSNTHASIGAMGFAVNYPAANKASVITSGITASTKDTAFTPIIIATFDNNSNVGIGTTSPSQKLEIAGGNAKFTNYAFQEFLIGNTKGYVWGNHDYSGAVGVNAFADDIIISANWHGVTGNTDNFGNGAPSGTFLGNDAISLGRQGIRFWTVANNPVNSTPVQRMIITNAGNVGIGTTSPAVTFVVNNGSGTLSNSFSLQNTTAIFASKAPVVGNVGNRVLLTVDNNMDYGAYIGSKLISAGAVGLVLGVKHGTHNDALIIDNSGNVGIGTTTPSATLQVVGNLTVSGNVTLGSGGITSNVTGVDCITFRTGGKICAA